MVKIVVDLNRALDRGYVQFGETRVVASVVELPNATDISVHLDEGGRLAGLELRELGRRLGELDTSDFVASPLEELLDGV